MRKVSLLGYLREVKLPNRKRDGPGGCRVPFLEAHPVRMGSLGNRREWWATRLRDSFQRGGKLCGIQIVTFAGLSDE